jgi:hypothetical protein
MSRIGAHCGKREFEEQKGRSRRKKGVRGAKREFEEKNREFEEKKGLQSWVATLA